MKKTGCLLIVIIILGILYIPVSSYLKSLRIYYKFSAGINFNQDTIFHENKTQLSYFPLEYDEESRLFYLCKVWGFVKYYGENPAMFPIMDSLLISAIPKTMDATNKTEFTNILKTLITPALDFHSTKANPNPNLDDYLLIDNQWMNDTLCLYDGIKADLDTIWARHTGQNHFAFNKRIGNIRLMNETEYPEFPDEIIRLLGLFRYWNVINYFYVYKNYMDNSWDQVLYETIPRFKIANSSKEYRKAIYFLTNQLRDTHASYPPTIDEMVFGPYRPNFRMMLINDTFVINKIRIPEYEKEDFQPGDIILQVDDQEIHSLSDCLGNYVCGGNYWSNQSFLCNAVLSRRDSVSRFTLLRDKDTLIVQSKNHKAYDMFQLERKMYEANEKNILYKWVNDSIAYFNLRSATPENFNKNYKAIRSASVIILDLRCYPHSHLILNLTDAFVPPHSFFAYITYPDTRFPGMIRYCKSSSNRIGSKNYYKGQVIVLVNEWTESYSEYMTMALQANPKTITVGNYSSGADGNVTFIEFPGRVQTVYSGIGIYYPDFTPSQRIGVWIDYVVEPTIESIKNNIDVAYEKAVAIAKQ
jgi:C-terminal processing protease CtpA/Prc